MVRGTAFDNEIRFRYLGGKHITSPRPYSTISLKGKSRKLCVVKLNKIHLKFQTFLFVFITDFELFTIYSRPFPEINVFTSNPLFVLLNLSIIGISTPNYYREKIWILKYNCLEMLQENYPVKQKAEEWERQIQQKCENKVYFFKQKQSI